MSRLLLELILLGFEEKLIELSVDIVIFYLVVATCFLPYFYHLRKRMIIYLWIPVSDYGLKWDLFKLFGKAFRGGQVSG